MDKQRRKQLQAQARQTKLTMGVVQITNTVNGKKHITSYPDLRNQWQTIQNHLNMGIYSSAALVEDWKRFGPQHFEYSVLEEAEQPEGDYETLTQLLRRMERPWLEKLQPYGDNGYNHPPRW